MRIIGFWRFGVGRSGVGVLCETSVSRYPDHV